MLTKKIETVKKYTYYFNGTGPYSTPEEAVKDSLERHLYYDSTLDVEGFLEDKELLIALGEWAKLEKETENAS